MPSILCVDDNAAHCYAVSRVLRNAGYDVLEAHTVAEALSICLNQRPDLILLDIHLPDETGYEFLKRLRSDPSTKETAVIMHSATEEVPAAKANAQQLGADAFLTFPVEAPDLLLVVRGILARPPKSAGVL